MSVTVDSSGVIEGRIVERGTTKGVANARLTLKGSELRCGNLTDASGAFRFEMLRPGQYTITARAAGWAASAETEIDLDVGETKQLLLHAQPAHSINADIIIEETGEPCTNSYVVLRNPAGLAEDRGDRKGRVTIDGLLPGRYAVTVRCATWGTATPPAIVVDRSLVDLRWIIPAGPRVRGTILHRDGTPGSGIMVYSDLLGTSDSNVGTTAVTDSLGRFELRGLRPGSHSVRAKIDDVLTSTIVRIERVDVDNIVLRPKPEVEATLEGTVVTIDDRPVPGMRLVLEPSRAPWEAVPSKQVVTDGEGRFSTTLKDESISIYLVDWTEFALAGSWNGRRFVSLTPGSNKRIRLVVSEKDQTVRGRVVDGSREPIVGAEIVAISGDDRHGELPDCIKRGWVRPEARALSGGDGQFELRGLAPGSYAIHAKAAGREAFARHVQAPGAIELVIEERGSISGRVVGLESTHRILVIATHSSSMFSRQGEVSTPSGVFSLRDLPAGHYRLTARGGGVGGTAEVDVGAGQHLRDVQIELGASAGISGRVVSARDGRGIADCGLLLRGEPELIYLSTDADGAFVIDEAGPGPRVLQVMCSRPSHCPDSIGLNLPSDRRLDLGTITLPLAPEDTIDLGALGLELRGNEVVTVRAASAAFRAGLRVGEVITSVGDFDVRGRPEVLGCLMSGRSGHSIEVSLAGGARRILTVP